MERLTESFTLRSDTYPNNVIQLIRVEGLAWTVMLNSKDEKFCYGMALTDRLHDALMLAAAMLRHPEEFIQKGGNA